MAVLGSKYISAAPPRTQRSSQRSLILPAANQRAPLFLQMHPQQSQWWGPPSGPPSPGSPQFGYPAGQAPPGAYPPGGFPPGAYSPGQPIPPSGFAPGQGPPPGFPPGQGPPPSGFAPGQGPPPQSGFPPGQGPPPSQTQQQGPPPSQTQQQGPPAPGSISQQSFGGAQVPPAQAPPAQAGPSSAPVAGPSVDDQVFPREVDVVTLNVGGRRFETTLATLRSQPGSLLAEKFSEESLKKVDATKALFIDRNPDAFESVLEFLRTRKRLHNKRGISLAAIEEEFRFWRVIPSIAEALAPSPAHTLAEQTRQRTVAAILRDGSIYIEVFMRMLRQELELAAQTAKSEVYLNFGSPPSASHKGKRLHDTNLHKWLTLRRGHLSILVEAIRREGFLVEIATGLPNEDWIWFRISWPLIPNDPIPGSYTFE
ncbi:MAG: hypothetical protein Q8P67_07060 [archaeon]|nr:hypothetical protein [archaeon]